VLIDLVLRGPVEVDEEAEDCPSPLKPHQRTVHGVASPSAKAGFSGVQAEEVMPLGVEPAAGEARVAPKGARKKKVAPVSISYIDMLGRYEFVFFFFTYS
jgi:hypothetical protein